MNGKIAIRDSMGTALLEKGGENKKIVVLDADLATSIKVDKFSHEYPERFFQMGIAEQNMICVAAGLATFGFIPFAGSFACFSAKRACDQIRISVAQPFLNVKIIGAYAGLFTGKTGATHQSVQDIAIMRSMPNMVVVEPCDAIDAEKLFNEITEYNGPVYYRATRDPLPLLLEQNCNVKIGKAIELKKGRDVVIIAQGFTTHLALEAANILEGNNVSTSVLNVSTIKPLDNEIICDMAEPAKLVVTVENHSVIGGLGSAVCEVLSEKCPTYVLRLGIKDVYGESGANEDLLDKHGLNSGAIVNTVLDTLQTMA